MVQVSVKELKTKKNNKTNQEIVLPLSDFFLQYCLILILDRMEYKTDMLMHISCCTMGHKLYIACIKIKKTLE